MGGYMSNRTYQCTRCNEVFTYNSDRDALYCPICGSTARYVSKPTATVNQTTASGKYYNVVFTDPSTGIKIGSATVPDNWKYGASLKSYNQSLLVNYLSICQVQKNDNTALMFVKTGDNFLDVRNGIFQNEGAIVSTGLHEVAPQVVIFQENGGLYFDVAFHCVSEDFWNRLSPAAQQIFTEEAAALHEEETALRFTDMDRFDNAVKEAGCTVTVLSDEEVAAWKELAQPVIDAKIDEISGREGCEVFKEAYEYALSVMK